MGLGSVPGVAKTVGYTEVHAQVLCIAWIEQAKAPLLLVSLASQTLLGLSPDLASAAQGGCAVWCSLAHLCNITHLHMVGAHCLVFSCNYVV